MDVTRFGYDGDLDAFRLTVNGEERLMPALKGSNLKRWHATYARAYAYLFDIDSMATADDLAAVFQASANAEDDLVGALLAYDRTAALGGADWIEESLTLRQLIEILRRIARHHA